ncbi:Altered inheritance of mitochondria protein 6 [Recurvomyces mirabilis]|uniref:Altered inheritance of mitochondria protein 6 n=1 Tax=Recurvomyces mirabilis TaxID=574656 RepID=A0AAE0WXI4_9PEZI|nr:Altered inheritance of mitochondria protein 6 [Recurvomyces mirabilis]KAK5162308.1 Altered inheritance of mitochondria protein 6 [Recurvomyces mirabilis]
MEGPVMHSAEGSYRDSIEDDDYLKSNGSETPPSRFGKLLSTLHLGSRNGRDEYDYEGIGRKGTTDGLLRSGRPREPRRNKKAYAMWLLRKAVIASPFVILMMFGVIHILTVIIGRARLFWNFEVNDDFLPNWGKPGHMGEGLAKYPTDATRDVQPIPCHSHNDYWRRIPLFDAIHWGFTSVEADVWLFDDELYVGHNLAALAKNRTFRSLYVDPLVELIDHMNPQTDFSNTTRHGIFDVDPSQSLVLLVDFKTDGHELFPVVARQLEALRKKDYLTYWDGDKVQPRAITVVGTGNTPFDLVIRNTTYRDIFFDAPLDKLWEAPPDQASPQRASDEDLDLDRASTTDGSSGQGHTGTSVILSPAAFNTSNSYYASVSFGHTVGFVWHGEPSSKQLDIIRGQVHGAHSRGLKTRYWDTPSWPVSKRNHIWHVLMQEGADVLNADDLKAAAVDQWKAKAHDWW